MPADAYVVAASGGSSIFIWEVLASPRGAAEIFESRFVREVRLPNASAVSSLQFLPNSDTLMGHVQRSSDVYAIFLEPRSGREVLRLQKAKVLAVSPRGDLAVGQFVDAVATDVTWNGFAQDRAIWNITSGAVMTFVPVPAGRSLPFCFGAAFSPNGDKVAVAVSYDADNDNAMSPKFEIWSSSTGQVLCTLALPLRVLWHVGQWGLTFDGDQAAICSGSRGRETILALRSAEGGCELAVDQFSHPCEDVSFAGGLRLLLDNATASIWRTRGAGAGAVAETALPWSRGVVMHSFGQFAPGGRAVLLGAQLRDEDGHVDGRFYLWSFADGLAPRLVDEGWQFRRPRFSPDGRLLAGVVHGGRDVAVVDLAGRAMHLQADTGAADVKDVAIALSGMHGWLAGAGHACTGRA